MLALFELVEKVAGSDSTVLIHGESGTGKELVARAIHDLSDRQGRNFVAVNCAAIPDELLESELFGHVKGSFTGAVVSRMGRFELADKGTLFLDEIGDMKPSLQVKLLRVLQSREVEPVGGSRPKKVDVRIIAATNQNLEQLVADRQFQQEGGGPPLKPQAYHADREAEKEEPLRHRPASSPLIRQLSAPTGQAATQSRQRVQRAGSRRKACLR